jgi:hypothetical protein
VSASVSRHLAAFHTATSNAGYPATYLRTVTAPAGLPTGTYTASLAVVDPSGYLAPMALANTSRLTDGSYRLGRVGVALTGPITSRRG